MARAAEHLGVCPRTVRSWQQQDGDTPRGRPPQGCSPAARNEVIHFLRDVSGPAVGLAALRALFDGVARCVLADLLRRYRCVWRYRYRQHGFRLDWRRAGAVWAMDFSEACRPIDGVYDYLFAVRDLASHRQLAWLPVSSQSAAATSYALTELFRIFGPPLVIKNDNGAAFIAEQCQATLAAHEVLPLFSPPRCPLLTVTKMLPELSEIVAE